MFDITKQTNEEYRRERIKSKGELYDAIAHILFINDPVGIGYFDNIDEYEPEVDTIIHRLEAGMSAMDIKNVVHEEFMRWFNDGKQSNDYGKPEIYEKIASEIYEVINKS